MTIKHTNRCPFADLDGSIHNAAGECPCQDATDVMHTVMQRAREDLREEEEGDGRWIVFVPSCGQIREATAPDASLAALSALAAIGADGRLVAADPDLVSWVCHVVPLRQLVEFTLGQVAGTRIEVGRYRGPEHGVPANILAAIVEDVGRRLGGVLVPVDLTDVDPRERAERRAARARRTRARKFTRRFGWRKK